jgi:hypothetical protein
LIAVFNVVLFSFMKQQNVVALVQGTLPNKAKERLDETNEKWKYDNLEGNVDEVRRVEEARGFGQSIHKNLISYCDYFS